MMYPFLVISDSFSSTSSIKREARELPDYLRYRIEQNQIFVQSKVEGNKKSALCLRCGFAAAFIAADAVVPCLSPSGSPALRSEKGFENCGNVGGTLEKGRNMR